MSSTVSGVPACIRALRRRIEESLVTSISKQRFLPRDKLYEIFTLPAIEGAVEELNYGAEYRIKLVDTVNNDCKVVFAILIYNRLENYIAEFRKHGFVDSQLPLTKERAEEIMGCEFGPQFALEFQWMFLPYVFRKGMLECSYHIGERYILPFITADQIGTGAYGDVDKVRILPSQHEFTDQTAVNLDVVRKRLRVKGRVKEFDREDRCLRLLNRLKHQNIIPLLGSYTYREEHAFLFPYFNMNLDEFLRRQERPGHFRWNFTFCSALTGLASALSKMHRLHLNMEEHDVDFEAIGYHHDLRPPNVLVSEDTFILADFGLGSLKDLAALSHTPYKIVSGDYIAPECTDMDEHPQTVNRSIDIWAFGCLIVEIVTYMTKGPDGIREFRKSRLTKGRLQQFKDAGFYRPDGEPKTEVLDWIEQLKSFGPKGDLVHRLLQLSLDALKPDPRNRPNMDEMNHRLADLSLQEHLSSIQLLLRNILEARDESSPLKHHLNCLQFAQERLQIWSQVLGLGENNVPNYDCGSMEGFVKMLRPLFHLLQEDQHKRASGDLSALRSCQHQMDHCVKQLWDSIPENLRDSAGQHLTSDENAGGSLLVQTSSPRATVFEDRLQTRNLSTGTHGLLSEFERAAQSFKSELPDSISLDEITQTDSIQKVYDVTDTLQADQELRNLSKIQQYLKKLRSYAELVKGAIGGNHEFLAFLWGPLAFLLLWSCKEDKAYRSIIDAVAEIGEALPDFQEPGAELSQKGDSKEILPLLFKDILNFYLVTLRPFGHPGWMYIFDRTWPKQSALISEVASHIGRLTRMMRTEIRLEHIQQEYEFRKTALERFEKQEREARKQEFSRIQGALNVRSYDDALYRLRGVCSSETGSWLFRNETYISWFSGLQGNCRILWLVGIPGAGKTVLSCAIVDHIRVILPKSTGCAFLSYENENITAISVIHFLIFQLADRDDDLMGVVCESSAEDLKTNLTVAKSLLTSLIRNSSPVCLVIDGIDEISIDERQRLITELLELVEVCEGLRIVLSSRPEADLVHRLENAVVSIRLHDHNEESISAYVSQRSHIMFEKLWIPIPEQAEIQRLLLPLGSRAKGMFLYARLVMDMIEDIQDFSEIQNELVVLPESLDAAYHRIIMRLENGKDKRKAEKAQRLLGWVACTPSPLTVEEVGQALALKQNSRDQVYHVMTKLDAVKELGPIVESFDGYIRFVHFTAKEYIFSPHLGAQLIDKNQATLDLAIRCIDYLCQRHHDLDLTSEEVSENVLKGQYSFHAFSAQMWFELCCQYLRSTKRGSLPPQFVESLQMLRQIRSRPNYQTDADVENEGEKLTSTQNEIDFKPLEQQHPRLHQFLREISRFRTSSFTSTGKSLQAPHKNEDDPLTISEMSRRIHRALDARLCMEPQGWPPWRQPRCHEVCVRVLFHYGSRPFKCEFSQCEHWRHGFVARGLRDKHRASHDLPWKCLVHGCEFGRIGFLSRQMREKHLKERHHDGQLQSMFDSRNINKDSVEPLLSDLIRENRVDVMRGFLSNFDSSSETLGGLSLGGLFYRLRLLAAYAASGDMLDLLDRAANKMSQDLPQPPTNHDYVFEAITARNGSAMEYLITRSTPCDDSWAWSYRRDRSESMCQLMSMNWTEGTELWCKWHRKRPDSDHKTASMLAYIVTYHLANNGPFKAAAKHRGGEQQLVYIWKHPVFLSSFNNRGHLATRMLRHVAEFSCSTTLAEYLLEKGAQINGRRGHTTRTALHCAAERDSFDGAHMMRFLLQHGADPEAEMEEKGRLDQQNPERSRRRIRDQVGPRNIRKWLRKDWDELVQETKDFRDNQKV